MIGDPATERLLFKVLAQLTPDMVVCPDPLDNKVRNSFGVLLCQEVKKL